MTLSEIRIHDMQPHYSSSLNMLYDGVMGTELYSFIWYIFAELTHQLKMLCTYDFMVSVKPVLSMSVYKAYIIHCLKHYFSWK